MFVIVAGRVFAARHHHHVVIHFLGLFRKDIAFALLRDHMPDDTAFALEVIHYLVRLILVFFVLEDRFAFVFVRGGVQYAFGVDKVTVEVAFDEVRLQFHVLVFDNAFSVEESVSVTHHHHRVFGRITHRRLQRLRRLRLLLRPFQLLFRHFRLLLCRLWLLLCLRCIRFRYFLFLLRLWLCRFRLRFRFRHFRLLFACRGFVYCLFPCVVVRFWRVCGGFVHCLFLGAGVGCFLCRSGSCYGQEHCRKQHQK